MANATITRWDDGYHATMTFPDGSEKIAAPDLVGHWCTQDWSVYSVDGALLWSPEIEKTQSRLRGSHARRDGNTWFEGE